MKHPNIRRRDFLKTSALTGVGLSMTGCSTTADAPSGSGNRGTSSALDRTPPRPPGQRHVAQLTTDPLERVRIGVIGLNRGLAHVRDCLGIGFAEVVAVCDIRDDRARAAAKACVDRGRRQPAIYSGSDRVWEEMVDRDDIDVVYVATPWDSHVAMCVQAMERGKHAFVEVPAAITIADCWRLVDTSERTQRHCLMLENCCYGENELFVLNLARHGVFGKLTHAECAYLHDLREVLFTLGSEGDWRRDYHQTMDGNLYPTHGLGPVAQYLGLGRGDRLHRLVSMSSREASLTGYRNDVQPNGGRHAGEKYLCGDMNTSILRTALGRTVMLQHNVVSPRPYSRINSLQGTKGIFSDYPPRLALDDPEAYGLNAKGPHQWLDEKDLARMRERFTHPLWAKLVTRAAGSTHGGMDFVMNWRHLDCLRRGVPLDSDVYDAAEWSCIVELSTHSVATGGMPVKFPDFTRGQWQARAPIGIAEAAGQRT